LQQTQRAMAAYLRSPDAAAPPAGVEQRRLDIYRRLVFNNIESLVGSAFPVVRSLYEPAGWEALVRRFIQQHRCASPYFPDLSAEFLSYLLAPGQADVNDPPFLGELAHYEWVELALSVSMDEPPVAPSNAGDLLDQVLLLSPVAWPLCYRFPVQRIGPVFRPAEPPEQPTWLVVYRDHGDAVRFMELSPASAALLAAIGDAKGLLTAGAVIDGLAGTGPAQAEAMRSSAYEVLKEFADRSVIGCAV